MEDKTYLFVYGTLLKNHRANQYLDGCKYIGEARTELNHFDMVSCNGSYPMVFNNGSSYISGEIYEIPTSLLARLDIYEGCDFTEQALYKRDYFDYITAAGEKIKAIMYYQTKNIFNLKCTENVLLENNTYKWR